MAQHFSFTICVLAAAMFCLAANLCVASPVGTDGKPAPAPAPADASKLKEEPATAKAASTPSKEEAEKALDASACTHKPAPAQSVPSEGCKECPCSVESASADKSDVAAPENKSSK